MDRKEFDDTLKKMAKLLKGKKDYVVLFAGVDGSNYYQSIYSSVLDKTYAVGMIERMKSVLINEIECDSEKRTHKG